MRASVREYRPGTEERATEWLRASGMRIAIVDTGGDSGHAPGRRVYQRAGFTLLPVARYLKAI